MVTPAGNRVNVLWPPGFEISFESPHPRLLAGDGTPVAVVGDPIRLGGGSGPGDSTTFAACEVNGVADNTPQSWGP